MTVGEIVVLLVAAVVGLVLWTMFTFIAIDQGDRLVWRLAPFLSGAIAASIYAIVGTLQDSLLVGAIVTAVLLVLERVLLDSFENVRASYRSE